MTRDGVRRSSGPLSPPSGPPTASPSPGRWPGPCAFPRSPTTPPKPPGAPRAAEGPRDAEADERDGVDPQRLLRYYADCLTAQAAAGMRPDRDAGRNTKYFLLAQGEETIQSGRGPHIVAPGSLPRPQDGRSGSGSEAGTRQEYWYGYPAITPSLAGRRPGAARDR
ncbi:hypothetical protein GCM10023238_11550 [Streptomyces heliomycini]